MIHRREIDGLRALAVLPVILFHAGFETFRGGFVGVDVFFVISGYLITSIILAELETGQFSIAQFYERRARRILPALFLVMLVCIPFAWLWFLPGDMRDFSESLVAVSAFSSNILFWRESGYFDSAADLKPLLHTWSLAVEEQYYLIFPLLLMLAWRFGKRWIQPILAVLGIASLCVAQWGAVAHPDAAFYLLPTRGWELLIGAFAASYLSKSDRHEFGKRVSEVCGAVGLALIVYPIFAYDDKTPFPGFYALLPTIGAVLIIMFGTQHTAIGRFIGNRALVGIGLISYSAYLWHQPLFAFFRHSGIEGSVRISAFLVIVTMALAYCSWRYVEKPFRERQKFGRKQVFAFSGSMMILFVAFGVAGHETNGFEGRAHVAAFSDLDYDTSKRGYANCESELIDREPKLGYCYGSDEIPTALVVGDSHADDKFYGIEKFTKGYEWRLVGNASCPPLYGVRFKGADGTVCTEKLQKIFSYIENQKQLQLVVLSFAHAYPLSAYIAADHVQRHFDPSNAVIEASSNPSLDKIEAFNLGLRGTVDYLRARKIRTIISMDVPELTFFPSDCLKGRVDCSFGREAVVRRQEIHRRYIHELSREYEDLLVFDPLDMFCVGDSCELLRSGRTLYRDSHHLSHYGSEVYGRVFSEWYSRYADGSAAYQSPRRTASTDERGVRLTSFPGMSQ